MNPEPTTPSAAGMGRCQRRQFLKKLAAAAGSSALLAELPWWSPLRAAPPGNSPADRVRLGLIGPGSRGQALLAHLRRTPGVEIAALCDDYEPNLNQGLKEAGGKPRTFTDYRKLLELPGVDGVVIATPLHLHARMCLDALAAGKHVFCEKSLAYTIEECQAIARAFGASRKVFQIGHQRLYSAPFLRAHELVRGGGVGPITQMRACWHRNGDWRRTVPAPELERRINWRLYREFSCGLMTELGSHHLQVANWFLNAHPLSCAGYGSINYWKDGRELEDNVNVVYRYPGGVHVIFDSLISNAFYGMEIQIMGPNGTIEAETGRLYAENPPPAPGIVQLINGLERGVFETIPIAGPSWVPDLKKDTRGFLLDRNLKGDDGTAVQMAAFANAIRLNEPIPRMIEHACHSGVAVLMGQFAIEQGREIVWPQDFTL